MSNYVIRDDVKHYLTMTIDLIDNCEFEKLYTSIAQRGDIPVRDITDALYEAGINPLEFMDYVPAYFLRGSRRSNKGFIIPNHIKYIEGRAFAGTDIDIIKIPEGCTEILDGAFSNCPDLYKIYFPNSLKIISHKLFTGSNTNENNGTLNIIYNGTREEWNNIKKSPGWASLNPQFDVIVECRNDVFSYSTATGEIDLI